MLGPGCPLWSPASVESSVSLCLLVPQSCPWPGPPSRTLPPSYHPPLGPGDVDSDPSPNLDLNLLSRAGASTLVKKWSKTPQESFAVGLGLLGSLTGALGGKGDASLPPGGSFMFSLLIPKKQLPVPPSGEVRGPGISAPSCGGPYPSGPMVPCRVLHQQDPFEGL